MFEKAHNIVTYMLAMLMALWVNPTKESFESTQRNLFCYVDQLKKDNVGISNMIIAGIMIVIVGFVMLFIGLYIVFTVQTSLPAINSTTYNNTVTSLNNYVATTFPIMGLSLMVVGFAIIIITLLGGLGGGARVAR